MPVDLPAPPVPPEADALYARVRQAEGTAKGDGFVVYGGQPFDPGKEHPGELARRAGPQGVTHAAGPGQWQPGTWNGLKPDFRARFGREPDFSSHDDQKAMVWLNAGKVYPGGQAKLQADIAAGKLDTSKLAPQWAGFGASSGSPGAAALTGRRMPGRLGGMGPLVPGGDAVPEPAVAAPRRSMTPMPEAPGTPIEVIPATQSAPIATSPPNMQLGQVPPIQVQNLPNLYRDALAAIMSGRRRPAGSMFG